MLAPPPNTTQPLRVWAGTALSKSQPGYRHRTLVTLVQLVERWDRSLQLQLTVNFYDGKQDAKLCSGSALGRDSGPHIECASVLGMKGLFWKRVFTPEEVMARGATHVWFFDNDLHVTGLDLSAMLAAMRALGIAIAQPSIAGPIDASGREGRTTDIEGLRAANLPPSDACVASATPIVEVMTPFFDASAWVGLHRQLLTQWPDDALAKTDHGLNDVWCRFTQLHLRWRYPACAVVRTATVVHNGSNAINSSAVRESSRHMPEVLKGRLYAQYYVQYLERATLPLRCFSLADVARGSAAAAEGGDAFLEWGTRLGTYPYTEGPPHASQYQVERVGHDPT